MSTEAIEKVPEEFFAILDEHYQDLEAEYAPDPAFTLGCLAVLGDLGRSVILVHAEPWLDSELPDANENVQKEIQETRERLEEVDPHQLLVVGSKIVSSEVPQFLLDTLGVEYQHQIFERLVEKQADGSPAVPEEAFLNFLQWHNYRMIAKRERFMEQDWPLLKQDYKYGLRQAVKQGWLPEVLMNPDRLEALEQIEITIDDGMILHEDKIGASMTTKDTDLGTKVYFPQYTFMEISRHELSHVMAGVEIPKDKQKGRFSGGLPTHGLYRLFDEKYFDAGKVFDEAFTEHVAQTLHGYDQKPDIINPSKKGSLDPHYIVERKFLDALCNGGVKPIDIRLFGKAYFEDSTRWRKPALRKLKKALKKAFPGRDVLGELADLMSEGEYEETINGLPELTRSLRDTRFEQELSPLN